MGCSGKLDKEDPVVTPVEYPENFPSDIFIFRAPEKLVRELGQVSLLPKFSQFHEKVLYEIRDLMKAEPLDPTFKSEKAAKFGIKRGEQLLRRIQVARKQEELDQPLQHITTHWRFLGQRK